MKLNALIMSRSAGDVKLLVAAFAELGIEYRVSPSPSETLDFLTTSRHSALIIDFEMPHVAQVVRLARGLISKRKPVLFGMIGPRTPIAEVFDAGANFVLYKPLDFPQVMHSLRTATVFMQQDRRTSPRHRGETLAYLELPGGAISALVQDLNEHGLSLQAAEVLMPMRSLSFRFLLPGTTQVIRATGQFMWTDKAGRAGLLFTSIPPACQRDLEAWLRKRGAKKPRLVHAVAEPLKGRALAASHLAIQ